jgi:hypothetical protein
MQDVARRALSQYCLLFKWVAYGLDLRYYPCRPTGSTEGVVVSPVGEGNPRLSSTFNLAAVLNTELDHALDQLSRARAEVAELQAKRAERRHQDDDYPAPSVLSTCTARLRVDTMPTAPLTAGPG